MTASPEIIIKSLADQRYRLQNEDKLQKQIEEVLDKAGVAFEREVKLSKEDRIDFLIEGGIGIEVKINRAESSLILQAGRYLAHDRIKTLILVTIRPTTLPEVVLKKPLYTLALWNKLRAF